MTGTWYFGASINLVGSILINLGTNVMKLGHNKRAALEMRTGKTFPVRNFQEWQFGVGLFIAGNIANFISFGYAAQSLLAALGSIQFVSNVFFASMVLNETVTKSVVTATACICVGCVGLVFFGSHESKEFTVVELMHLYHRPVYISYILFTIIIVSVMYGVYKIGKGKASKDGISSLSPGWYRLFPVSYALFSGLLGTQSVVFSKTISTLLRVTVGGNSQMGSWFTWTIIGAFLCTSTFWVTRLNKALTMFPALLIVPTMQISWTLFSIISGMLYFEEYKGFTYQGGCLFATAVLVVFIGVYLLTKDRKEDASETEGKYMGHRRLISLDTGSLDMQGMAQDEHAPLNKQIRPLQDNRDENGSLLESPPRIANQDTFSPTLTSTSQAWFNQNQRYMEGEVQQTENQDNGRSAIVPEGSTDFAVDVWDNYLAVKHKDDDLYQLDFHGVQAVPGSVPRIGTKARRH